MLKPSFYYLGVQRDSYLESPPIEEMSLSFDNSGTSQPPLVNRKVSAVLPRPAQRSDSTVSLLPSADDLSPFGWYVEFSQQEALDFRVNPLRATGFI